MFDSVLNTPVYVVFLSSTVRRIINLVLYQNDKEILLPWGNQYN